MKKPKFVYVPQRTEDDCGIACIAMVTGKTYQEVGKHFHSLRYGVKFKTACDFIMNCGVGLIMKTAECRLSYAHSNAHMLLPFADFHIMSVNQFIDLSFDHCLVMDRRGTVYNPSKVGKKKLSRFALARDYYLVNAVAGLFYDK